MGRISPSLKSKSKWSPNWLTEKLVNGEEILRATVARGLGRFDVIRYLVCFLIMLAGAWLILKWPDQRILLGRQFFRSLGFGGKLVYFLIGTSGIFLFFGSLRQLVPRRFIGFHFDVMASVGAGLVFAYQSKIPYAEALFNAALVYGPFAGMALTLRWRSTPKYLFFIFFVLLNVVSFQLVTVGGQLELFSEADQSLLMLTAAMIPVVISAFIMRMVRPTPSHIFIVSLLACLSATLIMVVGYRLDYLRATVTGLTPSRFWMVGLYAFLGFLTVQRATRNLELHRLLLFPSHWLGQVPYSIEDMSKQDRDFKTYMTGIFQLLNCVFLIGASWWLDHRFKLMTLPFPFHGVAAYFQFFFLSWLTFLVPVAAATLMGYRVPEPYIHPLLAANPGDRWRRWNTYYYEWFRTVVFIPVFRKTNSAFLAVMLTFVLTWFVHINPLLIKPEEFHRAGGLNFLLTKLLFFLCHGMAVYVGLRFPFLFPDGNRKRGWLGVLLVFILMALIHHLAILPLGAVNGANVLNYVH